LEQGQVGEPLAGRKTTLTLYPVAQLELLNLHNKQELKEKISDWLIFGGCPEIVAASNKNQKIKLLEETAYSYLLKDILELDKIKNSRKLLDLLRLLAFQVGNEVSLNELGRKIGLDRKTIERYLDLLEKTFVIYNLRGFSRNLRKEITQKSKTSSPMDRNISRFHLFRYQPRKLFRVYHLITNVQYLTQPRNLLLEVFLPSQF